MAFSGRSNAAAVGSTRTSLERDSSTSARSMGSHPGLHSAPPTNATVPGKRPTRLGPGGPRGWPPAPELGKSLVSVLAGIDKWELFARAGTSKYELCKTPTANANVTLQRTGAPLPALGGSTRPEEATLKMLEQKQVEELLTPAEVAALFRVNPKTVTRWARAGKITAIRTLGGHRRFRASEIQRCMAQMELVEQ